MVARADQRGMIVQKTHVVRAPDGFPLVLEHFGTGAYAADFSPVVLCPGVGLNRHTYDIDLDHSLARYLVGQGFDVWMLELRGQGRSKLNGHAALSHCGLKYWDMDTYVECDVPTMLDAVCRLSGKSQVTWIGHSLGGMLAYCLLTRYREYGERLTGIVTIGSPSHIQQPDYAAAMLRLLVPFLGLCRRRQLSLRQFAGLANSRLGHSVGLSQVLRLWFHLENTAPSVLQRIIQLADQLPMAVLYQWARSMQQGSLLSRDGEFDYHANLNHIAHPVLFVGGSRDMLAPVTSITRAFEAVASLDKTVRLFGTSGFELRNGAAAIPRQDTADYGHEDLLVGEATRTEVFPYIASWLREHA